MPFEVRQGQNEAVGRERSNNRCPPHGPYAVEATEGGPYVARCLACGLAGPEREDGLEAMLAFDQRWP